MPESDNEEVLAGSAGGGYHVAVMLREAVDALDVKPTGRYVDCTFGGGGHSREILSRLGNDGKLIVFDQDEQSRRNLPDDPRVIFVPENFRHLSRFLRFHQMLPADGVLADLGVSSHQFDEPTRGFSIRFDAPLDMRMDLRTGTTAAELLENMGEQELHKMFEQYGEVTNAKTLAKTIAQKRVSLPLRTINQFKDAVSECVKGNPNKYFAQVFQALRIKVNDEFGALEDLLTQIPEVLKPEGRVAIITFHSLEDRMVKQFFKQGSINEPETDEVFGGRKKSPLTIINKKPILPSPEEIKTNPRARSAKLRIAMKTGS